MNQVDEDVRSGEVAITGAAWNVETGGRDDTRGIDKARSEDNEGHFEAGCRAGQELLHTFRGCHLAFRG